MSSNAERKGVKMCFLPLNIVKILRISNASIMIA